MAVELSLLYDIGIIIAVAALLALAVRSLKQPLIFGYVLGGIIIGPLVLSLVKNPSTVSTLSELGIAFLLFIIGIEFDVTKLKEIGKKVILIGALQVTLCFLVGFIASYLLHFSIIESVFLGLVVAFSSTMIVVKLLSDSNEIDSIHGRLIIGIMLVQDIFAILFLSLISSGKISLAAVAIVIIKGFFFFTIAIVIAVFVLPGLLRHVIETPELLFIISLAICFVYSSLAYIFGYSLIIGAFVAGAAIASTDYNHEVVHRIMPLRDFFATIFFVTLGMSLVFTGITNMVVPLAVLFLLIIFIKPVITFICVKLFGYGTRTSFFTGTSIAQTSEFSLILAAQAAALGFISSGIATMTTLLAVLTITLTVYIMKYDAWIYKKFSEKGLGADTDLEEIKKVSNKLKKPIVVFGTHRMGMRIINTLISLKKHFVVVDHNPERVRELRKKKINVICADITNYEVHGLLQIERSNMIISTVHNYEANLALIKEVKQDNKKAIIIVATRSVADAVKLYDAGATYVVVPESLAGEKVSNYLIHLDSKGIKDWGKKHYKMLLKEEKSYRRYRSSYGRY